MKFCNYALVQIVQLSSGQIERSGTMQGSAHARQCDSSIAKARQRKSTENGKEKKIGLRGKKKVRENRETS